MSLRPSNRAKELNVEHPTPEVTEEDSSSVGSGLFSISVGFREEEESLEEEPLEELEDTREEEEEGFSGLLGSEKKKKKRERGRERERVTPRHCRDAGSVRSQ